MTEGDKSLDILGVKPLADSVNVVVSGTVTGAMAFLSKICMPAAEEYGLLIKDKVSRQREKNAEAVAVKAQKLLEARNETQTVSAHPKIIYSTLEQGSWATDDLVQSFWAGLLATACTAEGNDEGNQIFINILSQLTLNQVQLIRHACLNTTVSTASAGWIAAKTIHVEAGELMRIMKLADVHRVDRELDHLRSLGLIGDGFNPHSTIAAITLTALCLQLYAKSQGWVGSPLEYFTSISSDTTLVVVT